MSGWILVTGASGFVGAHLVRRLVERGERVKALVRESSDLRSLAELDFDRVKLAFADVRVEDRVFAAMSGCDRVYHLAANVSTDERQRRAIEADSLEGTRSVLRAARARGIRRVVVTSSILAFEPTSEPVLLDEDSAVATSVETSYVRAKAGALRIARDSGVSVVTVHPGMILGARDRKPTGTGQLVLDYLRMPPSVTMPLFPGGLNFVGVDDVVTGHLLAMERGRPGEGYVLGGDNWSYADFYKKLFELAGLAAPGAEIGRSRALLFALFAEWVARSRGARPGITRALVRDFAGKYLFVTSAKAERELGYRPRPAEEALYRSIEWFREHGGLTASEVRRIRLPVFRGREA